MSFCIFFKIGFPKFKEILLFFTYCGFGIGFLLDNIGLSWELHGPHSLLPRASPVLVPAYLDIKCGKKVVPKMTTGHPLNQYCPSDGPGSHPFVMRKDMNKI